MSTEISPAPTDEEAAAIVAAVEALWPRSVVIAGLESAEKRAPWRFSGRWWNRPIAARRERPW